MTNSVQESELNNDTSQSSLLTPAGLETECDLTPMGMNELDKASIEVDSPFFTEFSNN
jgi:hypothetical protein